METEIATWSKFPNGWKTTVKGIIRSKEINRSKGAGLLESQLGIQVEMLKIFYKYFFFDIRKAVEK